MKLIIAEKPGVAQAITEALGGGTKKDGYFESGEYCVTFCFGHMMKLLEPEEINPTGSKIWTWETIPFFNNPWRKKVGEGKEAQFKVISQLIQKADEIIHAGDPDEEGQLIVDEILDDAKIISLLNGGNPKKPIHRLLINDNNPKVIKKQLQNMKPNLDFIGLSLSAEARSVADQLYGFNLTRAYTLSAKEKNYRGVLSVGRVQTPILGLVVRRDAEIDQHQTQNYFTVNASISNIPVSYVPLAEDGLNEHGEIDTEQSAKSIVAEISGKEACLNTLETANKKVSPPLPFNLLKLQAEASTQFNLKPDVVLDITQRLREKGLITYNRSDSQYLNEEQFADSPEVIEAIFKNRPDFEKNMKKDVNTSIKSKAFDSSKVTAHHAIIPTAKIVDFSSLTKDELNVYQLLAQRFLLQFMPDYTYENTSAVFGIGNRQFKASSNVPIAAGWKAHYKATDEKEDEKESSSELATLKTLTKGTVCPVTKVEYAKKQTKPKKRYTAASLLNDLTRVADYVKDPEIKKLLKEKDKGKEGEHGGIGTPATRSSILKTLFERGFLEEKGKNITSTQLGKEFYSLLPEQAVFPDMTALWHQEQKTIEEGKANIIDFLTGVSEFINDEVARVRQEGLNISSNTPKCPECGKNLIKIKGKDGYFWGCSGYKDPAPCKATFPDKNNKPVFPAKGGSCPKCKSGELIKLTGKTGAFWACKNQSCKKTYPDKKGKPDLDYTPATVSQIHKCLECGKGLVKRKGANGDFWGCSGFPECKTIYPDKKGTPDFNKK